MMAKTEVTQTRFDARALSDFSAAALASAGLGDREAATVARLMVQADVRGVETHGLMRLPMYVDRLRSGGIDPRAEMKFVREKGATAVLDAAHGMGHLAAVKGMTRAIDLAANVGVGVVVVRRSGHFGAADGYAMLAAERGMIGLVTTNAPPALAPTGGLTPMFGTNPWAIATPAGRDNEPIVMDFALTSVARGRIRKAQHAGEPIPDTWATDAEGRPTTDPAAALHGLLLPIGGHKGYALALATDVLAAMLSGATTSAALTPPQEAEQPQDVGHFFLAIDVEAFLPFEDFGARVDALVEEVHGSRRAAGVQRVYVPGEIEADRADLAAASGVPLAPHVVAGLASVAAALGIAPVSPCR